MVGQSPEAKIYVRRYNVLKGGKDVTDEVRDVIGGYLLFKETNSAKGLLILKMTFYVKIFRS